MNDKIRQLWSKLEKLKASKAWMDGEKKAEAEVAKIRADIRDEQMAEMSPRERIDFRARLTPEEIAEKPQ